MKLKLNLKKIFASLIFILSFAAGAVAQSSSVTGTMPDNGGSLPPTCQVGYIYSKTSAVGGAIGLYFCNPANVLTAFPFTSNPFASGGVTNRVIPESNGSSQLVDSTLIETGGTALTSTLPWRSADGSGTVPTYSFTNATATGIAQSGTSLYLITPAQSVNFNNGASVVGSFNTNSGLFTTYGGAVTAGYGLSAVRGATSQKAETTSADANVLTYTPPAAVGTYRACTVISVSSATSGVISWTLSWTDSNGNAQANIAQQLFQMGTAAPNTTFTTSAAGNYYGCSVIDVNNAAASIIVKWVGGGTTAAKMSASIEREQ